MMHDKHELKKFNSKEMWKNYCAEQVSINIANEEPTFIFNGPDAETVENLFNEYLDLQVKGLLDINAELARISSKYGSAWLGIIPVNKDGEIIPYFSVAKSVEETRVLFDYIKLILKIDSVNINNCNYSILEEWDLINEPNNCLRYGDYEGTQYTLEGLNYKNFPTTSFNWLGNKIPYIKFNAKSNGGCDLENVPEYLFIDYERTAYSLWTDTKVNKGIIHFNLAQNVGGDQEAVKKIQDAIDNPETGYFLNESMMSLISNGVLQVVQGTPTGAISISKLQWYEQQIKKIGFIHQDTSNLGTKNTTNSETETLNADADTSIELKANRLEIFWQKFIKTLFIPFINYSKNLNINPKNIDIIVECSGSSRWLRNPNNQYVQSQQGTVLNPNDLNQNTDQSNNDENENEKSENSDIPDELKNSNSTKKNKFLTWFKKLKGGDND